MTSTCEAARLQRLVERMADVELLVVGDVLLDEYVIGDVERVSPEAPVPVVRVRDETVELGGAANVARNITALGARASLCAVVGDDEAGDRLRALLESRGIDPTRLVVSKGRPTTRKTRVVARGQQVTRLDREVTSPPARDVEVRLALEIAHALTSAHAVILEDYGKGVLSESFVTAQMRGFGAAGRPVIVDPKQTLAPYRGAALVKPNLRETETLSGVAIRNRGDLDLAVDRMRERLGDSDIVVTCGADGMVSYEFGKQGIAVATLSQEVFDVQGAGDTSVAALALARLAGASLYEAVVIANAAAGVVVGKAGTATASAPEVIAMLPRVAAAAAAAVPGGPR